MVGALSIVRFRTAIKDPVDTIFMFWAITIGIMSGAGLYLVTIISTLIIGILYFINYMIQIKKTNKLLLIVVCDKERAKLIINKLKNKKRCALKTEMYKADYSELTYEIAKRNDIEDILAMSDSEGITSINVLDID